MRIKYTLTRSKRKTTAIHVKGGEVEVRAPLRMPKRDIDSFVESKEKWITRTLAEFSEQEALRRGFSLGYGSLVAYRGGQYPIIAKEVNLAGFDGTCFFMPPNLTSEQIMASCETVYRMLAKRLLTAKTLVYAAKMSVAPTNVKITGARTRWGSCSTKKSINYSWRLLMADDDAIDYVVVHELAHLFEMNHSTRFWKIVGSIIPDYRERKRLLKGLQKKLNTEGWI